MSHVLYAVQSSADVLSAAEVLCSVLTVRSSMITGKEIYEKLLEMYGNPPWWSSDPYIVIVQSVLVHRIRNGDVLRV